MISELKEIVQDYLTNVFSDMFDSLEALGLNDIDKDTIHISDDVYDYYLEQFIAKQYSLHIKE